MQNRITQVMLFLTLFCVLFAHSVAPIQAAAALERIDITDGTALTLGNQDSTRPKLSADGRYIVFNSTSNNYVADDDNNSHDVFLLDQNTGEFELISKKSDGTVANGNSIQPSISADGRYVVYESVATDLVPSDTNGRSDIFLYDRQSDITERLSVSSDEDEANHNSNFAVISGDGNFVAFHSLASNLVTADDHFSSSNVFVRSISAGTTELVSISLDATSYGSGHSYAPSISQDGRYVTYYSSATNLVAEAVNFHNDIFLYDRQTDTTTFVSKTFDNSQSSDPAYDPSISADGRYITFSSNNDVLVAGDDNDTYDIFLYDHQEDTLIRVVDTTVGETTTGSSSSPILSSDGRYLVFSSTSDGLVAEDTNEAEDVFLLDLQDDSLQRVSISASNDQSYTTSFQAVISQDASTIVFASSATMLDVDGANLNEAQDIFIWETDGSVTTVAAGDPIPGNVPLNKGATVRTSQSFSQNNRYVVFESSSTNVVAGYTNPISTIYLYDSQTDSFEILSRESEDTPANNASRLPAMTPDARYIVFQSMATNLTEDALIAEHNIFRYDRQTDTMLVVTALANQNSENATISSDGRYIVFDSAADNLVADDDNETTDIFLYDVTEETFTLVSPGIGAMGNGESVNPVISANGLYVAFQSEADNLVADDTNGTSDTFIYDVQAGEVLLVSRSSEGSVANGESTTPVLSSDGRFVAYVSQATDIVPSVELDASQIFLFDSLNETTTLVSQVESIAGDDTSSAPSISADGTLVVFQSAATNLVTDDENAHSDIFVYSVNSGNIRVVSTDVSTAGTGNSSSGSISPDGSKIVFESLSLNWEEINTAYDNNGQLFLVTNELESDADPTPTPSPTTSSNSQDSNHSSHRPFVCSASRPSSAPHLLTVDRLGNTAVLWITPVAGHHTGYVIWYGEQLDTTKYSDALSVNYSTGMIAHRISDLDPNQTYTFLVQAVNNCAYSDSSNPITVAAASAQYQTKNRVRMAKQTNKLQSPLAKKASEGVQETVPTHQPTATQKPTESIQAVKPVSEPPKQSFWAWLLSLFGK